MFKQLLSDNRVFAGIVCLLVFIAAGLVYLDHVKSQANRDVQRTQENVKQWNARRNPQAQTEAGGHYHPDGTFHVGPHESDAPSETATTPVAPQTDTTAATPQGDISARMWTGKPLRETLSPGTLSDADFRARDAEIQRLSAERTALNRRGESKVTHVRKLLKEDDEISRQRKALRAERAALPPKADRTAEEQARYDALFKQSLELSDRSRELSAESKALIAETEQLFEKVDTLSEQIEVLRAQRRKTDD